MWKNNGRGSSEFGAYGCAVQFLMLILVLFCLSPILWTSLSWRLYLVSILGTALLLTGGYLASLALSKGKVFSYSHFIATTSSLLIVEGIFWIGFVLRKSRGNSDISVALWIGIVPIISGLAIFAVRKAPALLELSQNVFAHLSKVSKEMEKR